MTSSAKCHYCKETATHYEGDRAAKGTGEYNSTGIWLCVEHLRLAKEECGIHDKDEHPRITGIKQREKQSVADAHARQDAGISARQERRAHRKKFKKLF